MAFRLITADNEILKDIVLEIEAPAPCDGWPLTSGKINLQFPPRIKTRNKSGNWHVEVITGSWEPIVVWQGATGTQITMELLYVVTGKPWDIDNVAKNVRTVMSYFYRNMAAAAQSTTKMPLIKLKMYEVVPAGGSGTISKWRVESANCTHSDELIYKGGKVYPQVTTISLTMMMVTKMQAKDDKQKQQIDAPQKPLKEWY